MATMIVLTAPMSWAVQQQKFPPLLQVPTAVPISLFVMVVGVLTCQGSVTAALIVPMPLMSTIAKRKKEPTVDPISLSATAVGVWTSLGSVMDVLIALTALMNMAARTEEEKIPPSPSVVLLTTSFVMAAGVFLCRRNVMASGTVLMTRTSGTVQRRNRRVVTDTNVPLTSLSVTIEGASMRVQGATVAQTVLTGLMKRTVQGVSHTSSVVTEGDALKTRKNATVIGTAPMAPMNVTAIHKEGVILGSSSVALVNAFMALSTVTNAETAPVERMKSTALVSVDLKSSVATTAPAFLNGLAVTVAGTVPTDRMKTSASQVAGRTKFDALVEVA